MDATAAFYQALADSEAEDAALLAANAAAVSASTARAAVKPARRSRRVAAANEEIVPAVSAPFGDNLNETGEPETYEFRWDVEIPGGERRYGQKFMKQWKRVLQVQKMSPLVSAKLAAHHARFQLCVAPLADGGAAIPAAAPVEAAAHAALPLTADTITAREAEIAEALGRFRWAGGGSAQSHIEGEPARQHPAGWQGVRVWMTFARRDVEAVLGKKPKL